MNMKKRYMSPVVEIVEVAGMPVMTTISMETAPEGGEDDGGRGNDAWQTGEHRGDWSGIWDGM